MNTQNTPVHIKLWHREFWLMSLASLLLTMSVYMLIPLLPQWMMDVENFSPLEVGFSMGVFALGLYVFGGYCTWLVERYRRNVVCMWAMLAVALDILLLWYLDSLRSQFVELWIILLQRLVLGAAFGLAQMVLMSTLIIDTCESAVRTEANHSASWFSRMALALGPLAGVVACTFLHFEGAIWVATGCAVLALLLVKAVRFPFRTPEDRLHVMSLDRFFLPHGTVLFVHLMLVSLVIGMLLSLPHEPLFYAWMTGGFVLAILAQQFVFPDAELKSDIVTGFFMQLAALIIMLVYPQSFVSPVMIGLAAGLIGARFLLFFIKLSRHCQRGTSQSTYFLAWETGLTLGIAIGYGCLYRHEELLQWIAIVLTALLLLVYHFFTHEWFIRNKNR